MEIFRALPESNKGNVLTIGNFDGLHIGHQAMLKTLCQAAQHYNLPASVMSFSPSPHQFFSKTGYRRLMSFRDKCQRLAMLGADKFYTLRFNEKLASMPAQAFISDFLVGKLSIRCLIVGEDFRFGAQRKGDVSLLQDASQRYGFEMKIIKPVLLDETVVSSTRVRDLLEAGKLSEASQCLGRPYQWTSRVCPGDGRGRQIGIPTTNMALPEPPPLKGVYVVERVDGLQGVANIGTRPTFQAGERAWLEVHWFGEEKRDYGYVQTVCFLHKLRSEKRFSDKASLIMQIQDDIQQAKNYFEDRKG